MVTVEALDSIKVITRSLHCLSRLEQKPENSPSAELCATHKDRLMSRVTGRQAAVSDRPDLSSAPIIVSGGRGLGSKENYTAFA